MVPSDNEDRSNGNKNVKNNDLSDDKECWDDNALLS